MAMAGRAGGAIEMDAVCMFVWQEVSPGPPPPCFVAFVHERLDVGKRGDSQFCEALHIGA